MILGLSRKTMLLVAVGITLTIILDTSIMVISQFTLILNDLSLSFALFLMVVLVTFSGQFLLIHFISFKFKRSIQSNALLFLHKIVFGIQITLLILIIYMIIEIFVYGQYSTIILKIIIILNFSTASSMFALLGIQLIRWDRLNRNFVLILFASSAFTLCFCCLSTISFILDQFERSSGGEYVGYLKYPEAYLAGLSSIYTEIYSISYFVSFVMTWISTIILMRHFSSHIGKKKYWILVAVPLIYFLSQFQTNLSDFLYVYFKDQSITFGIVIATFFNLSKPVGGILFGLAFWSLSRSIQKPVIKDYMAISGCGMMLFFTANQPVFLTIFSYPPFGISAICLIGLSSYLIFLGIYSSAISISSDTALYKIVRRSIADSTNFLGAIGSAEEINKIEKRAINLTNNLADKIKIETGIQPSVEEADIKEYIKEIMSEMYEKRE